MRNGPAYQNLPPELKIQQTKVLFGEPAKGIVYEEGFGSQGSNSMPNKYNWRQRGYNYGSNPALSAHQAANSVVNEMLHNTGDAGIPITKVRRSENVPTVNTKIESRTRTYPKGYANMRQVMDASRLAKKAPERTTVQTRAAVVGAMRHQRNAAYTRPQVHIGAALTANDAQAAPIAMRALAAEKQAVREQELTLTKKNAMYHPSELQADGTVRPDRVLASAVRKSIREAQANSGASNGGTSILDSARVQTSEDGTTNTFTANSSGSQANEGLMNYGAEASDYGLTDSGGIDGTKKTFFCIGALLLAAGGIYMATR